MDSNHQGFTGTGFANADQEPGSAVTYRVSVPDTGHYALEVRYASVGTRSANVQVNGSVAGNFEFATTGSWTSWTTEAQTVELRAGENDIALIATVADGLPNVDSLTVTGNNPAAVDCSENNGGTPGGDTASSSSASSAVSSKASSSSASSAASSKSSSSSASSAASSKSSSSSASSAASSESSSSSSEASSGSSSSSSSSSPGDGFSLTIEEYDAGFCRVDGTVDNRHEGFTGVGYANTHNEPDSAVTYRVSVPDAGHYALEVRYASIDTRPADVLVNESVAGNFEFATTGSWTSWTIESETVELSAGENDIALVATGEDGLPSVDSLTIIGNSPTAVKCDDEGRMLPQDGNPVHRRFHSARTAWSQDQADIILSYQYDHGGWPRIQSYDDYYDDDDDDDKDDDDSDDRDDDGSDLGTIDNGATVTEMIFLAQVYKDTGDTRYRDAVRKAMDYLLDAQYASGGWPQYYPLRGDYFDHVTFKNNAMTRVLTALYHASLNNTPFDTDLFTDSDRAAMQHAIERGVDYILKAQWEQGGDLTVWCAQHDKDDYRPEEARDYELESLSGSDSAEIIAFLMTQPQTTVVEAAVKAGIAWYRSPDTYLADHTYDSSAKEKIVYSEGDRMWYRFYDLETNEGFFSDEDGDKYDDIMELSNKLRNSYTWGGNYGEEITSYADRVGY